MTDDSHHVLRLHGRLAVSEVNGPGRRAVIWFQGCSLRCPGCFNPDTHDPETALTISVRELSKWCQSINGIEGITISGGEPFEQPTALLALLQDLRRATNLSVIILTGLTMKEVQRVPGGLDLLRHVDILIAGRYVASRHLGMALRGSSNKVVHNLSGRYVPSMLEHLAAGEVVIRTDGVVIATGIDPLVRVGG